MPQNDRAVHQPGLFQCVEHGPDVPVGQRVEIGIEVHVFAFRLGCLERCEVVVAGARRPLDAGLLQQVVVVVGRQLDAEIGKILMPVARLLPTGRVDIDVVRVDQRYEQAKWLAQPGRAILQKVDDALTEPWRLTSSTRRRTHDVAPIVVGIGAAQSGKSIECPERGRLPGLDGVAGVGWIPARPAEVFLHRPNVVGRPLLAAVSHRGVGGIAQVPFALPDHLVACLLLEQRGDVRLAALLHQAGPEERLGHAIDRREPTGRHQRARRRALANRRIGAVEIKAVTLQPLQARADFFPPNPPASACDDAPDPSSAR